MNRFVITALFIGIVSGCAGTAPTPRPTGRPGPTASLVATPAQTPERTANPKPTSTPYVPAPSPTPRQVTLLDGDPDVGRITVTVPGRGWNLASAGTILSSRYPDTIMFAFTGDLWIYGNACAWSSTTPDSPATTVEEVIAALGDQELRDASAPATITVGEYVGQSITLHVPSDIATSSSHEDSTTFLDCDNGNFASLTTGVEGVALEMPERYAQGKGQIDEFWVVDVDGAPVVFDLAYWPDSPQNAIDELHGMAASATFNQ